MPSAGISMPRASWQLPRLVPRSHRLAQERGDVVAQADRGGHAILAVTRARLARLPGLARRLALAPGALRLGGCGLTRRGGGRLSRRPLLATRVHAVRSHLVGALAVGL